MATSRLATPILVRVSRSFIPRSARQVRYTPVTQSRPAINFANPSICSAPRFYSSEAPFKPSKFYSFSDVSNHPLHSQKKTQRKKKKQKKTPDQNITSLQIKKAIASPSSSRVLIDAREPHELATSGTIPGSLNIPVSSQPDAFFLSPEEFEERFGFDRPGKDVEVVFYCRAGVRSRAAASLAKEAGWKSVGEYEGSWLDWEGNGGEVEEVK